MAYEKFSVKQFREALFSNDRSVMDDETFKQVYNEYLDTSELYEKEEFIKVSRIHYLSGRINFIKISLKLQRGFLENFGIPYIKDLKSFEKFGHKLYWKGDRYNFLEQCSKIEKREAKFIDEVDNELELLYQMRENKKVKEFTAKESRSNFIKTFNSLGKLYFHLTWETSVEDYSHMIKQATEETKK
jgi:hypothetical protein